MAETKIRKENPPTVDQIITECCFVFELFDFSWFEDGGAEGAEVQLECVGVDTTIGGLAGSDGATRGEGEGEGVKKVLNGEEEGEEEISGEFEGLSDGETSNGETSNGDGEKDSGTGDNEGGKCDGDGEIDSFSLSLLVLCVLAAFFAWRSCLLYAISPCWPMCLSQTCKS